MRVLSTLAMILGTIGFLLLLIGGILSNSFVGGDRTRANYATEDSTERKNREKLWTTCLIIGVLCIACSVIIVVLL